MKVREVASENNPTFKTFLRLTKARGIKKYGLSLLSGRKQVREVLTEFPDRCVGIILSDQLEQPPVTAKKEILSYHLGPDLFRRIDIFDTRKPILIVSVEPFPEFTDDPWAPGCTLCVPFQDPGNVGAVIRSAAAFGVSRVVVLKEAAHPFHPKSFRVAGSNLLRIPLLEGPSLEGLNIDKLPMITLSPKGEDIRDYRFPPSFCLVPGMEGPGLSDQLKDTTALSIPMEPGVESLNAAMATGIALYLWRSKVGRG